MSAPEQLRINWFEGDDCPRAVTAYTERSLQVLDAPVTYVRADLAPGIPGFTRKQVLDTANILLDRFEGESAAASRAAAMLRAAVGEAG